MHTTFVGLDICGFGDPRRTADVQRLLRATMYDLAAEAFRMSGVPWAETYQEDRGDGALIVTSPAVQAAELLEPLAHHAAVLLRRSNRLAGEVTRLRLRMAMHVGDVQRDEHGLIGRAVIHLHRLLEAEAFKRVLAATPDADLGMLVSDELYRSGLESGVIDEDAYASLRVLCKETRGKAYLWLPPRFAGR